MRDGSIFTDENNRVITGSEDSVGLRCRGITLIELFGALGILAIVMSFASAPLERFSNRVELDVAGENIFHALRVSQRAAVRANVPVQILFSRYQGSTRLVAEYSTGRPIFSHDSLPRYSLPEHIVVSLPEGTTFIEYQPIDGVSSTGTMTLSSRLHSEYVIEIPIADLGGQLNIEADRDR